MRLLDIAHSFSNLLLRLALLVEFRNVDAHRTRFSTGGTHIAGVEQALTSAGPFITEGIEVVTVVIVHQGTFANATGEAAMLVHKGWILVAFAHGGPHDAIVMQIDAVLADSINAGFFLLGACDRNQGDHEESEEYGVGDRHGEGMFWVFLGVCQSQ
jgi:hypothetical protein